MAEEPGKDEDEDDLTPSDKILLGIADDVAKILKHTSFLTAIVWALIGLWVVSVVLTLLAS